MEKKFRILFIINIFIIISLLIFIGFYYVKNNPSIFLDKEKIAQMQQKIKNEKYIIHAGGYISNSSEEQFNYTNSKEALLNCYENGKRFCEFDFRISTDNELVCTHDWEQAYLNGEALSEPTNLETFLKSKIFNEFTSLCLNDLANFIKEHKDFFIVTDIKDNNIDGCRIIAENYPELLDNFIIQIYHEHEYNPIVSMGFKNIIYTLYNATAEELLFTNLSIFVKKHPLVGLTFWNTWADKPILLNKFKELNLPLFIHTVNDEIMIKEYFLKGISTIYTDSYFYN